MLRPEEDLGVERTVLLLPEDDRGVERVVRVLVDLLDRADFLSSEERRVLVRVLLPDLEPLSRVERAEELPERPSSEDERVEVPLVVPRLPERTVELTARLLPELSSSRVVAVVDLAPAFWFAPELLPRASAGWLPRLRGVRAWASVMLRRGDLRSLVTVLSVVPRPSRAVATSVLPVLLPGWRIAVRPGSFGFIPVPGLAIVDGVPRSPPRSIPGRLATVPDRRSQSRRSPLPRRP